MSQTIYRIGNALEVTMSLKQAAFGLKPEALFQLAMRQNTNRSFLFVSKVLGKHLPIHPAVLLSAGKLLALAYTGGDGWGEWAQIVNREISPDFKKVWERLSASRTRLADGERTLFLGFAETATGLARAVADCFDGEMAYISSTRLELPGDPLTFDESHSHARTHLLYFRPEDRPFLTGCKRVILVDDELTTGNTALRLIEKLHEAYGIREFVMMAILDCSDGENRAALEKRLGIEIKTVSLLQGCVDEAKTGEIPPLDLEDFRGLECGRCQKLDFVGLTPSMPRKLTDRKELDRQAEWCRKAAKTLPGGTETLYLGTGEFIFVPNLLGGFAGVSHFHSTTQSPVYPVPGSAVQNGVRFDPPDCYSPIGFLYNVPEGVYRNAVIVAEKALSNENSLYQLAGYLEKKGVRDVWIVTL